jgi:hypothetical protein
MFVIPSRYRFLTVPVDEFMTTNMYNGVKQTVLKAVQRRVTGATVRGLLWCVHTLAVILLTGILGKINIIATLPPDSPMLWPLHAQSIEDPLEC